MKQPKRAGNETVRRLLDYAADTGWAVSHTKGGHLKFSKPGSRPVFCSSTSSDRRALLNARADLRRAA